MIAGATRYFLGPLSIAVSGGGDIAEHVRSELSALEDSSAPEPSIEFIFSSDMLPPLPKASSAVTCSNESGILHAEHSGLRYSIENVGDDHLKVVVTRAWQPRPRLTNLAARFRFFNWNYLSPAETLAKNFFYDVFDYVCQISLVRRGATFVHSSAIDMSGTCLLISGVGGVGKSTSALRMVIENNGKYLSDDLAIIDRTGRVWRSPKKIQIYGYNVKGSVKLKAALLAKRSLLDKLSWHLRLATLGDKRVRRRVLPEEFFGREAVARVASIDCAILLNRNDGDSISISDITSEELAIRNSNILMSELTPFGELSAICQAQACHALIPSRDALRHDSYLMMLAAFRNCRGVLVSIPGGTDPATLLSTLDTILHGNCVTG